jgi:pyruvate,orthophosphate dikinase
MVGAAALVTTLGGVASHAAVVARSWSIPAVTGARDIEVRPEGILIAGRLIPEGQLLTVDGATGAVYEGDRRLADQDDHPLDLPAVRTLRRWAADLGIEPGAGNEPAQASGSRSARDADVSLLEFARTVQLKGLCTPDRAAAALAIAQHRIDALLDAHGSHFQSTPRGVLLTPEGREWLASALDAERTSLDRAALNRVYERFTELNARFKELVSTWQLHTSNAAPTPETAPTEDGQPAGDPWSAVVVSLTEIDAALHPLIEETAAQLPRLAAYAPRFRAALTALRAGDPSMLASPLKDSYHTVWFEFHEELIHATARDRATEERGNS